MSSAATNAPPKARAKVAKDSKSKKAASGPKKARSYPPFSEMINEAIVALKERTGSSQIAIAKFIEEKQKSNLPTNFKKLLLVQLKKLVVNGKLVKVKNSFKLPSKTASVAGGEAPAAAVAKPKAKNEASTKKKVTGMKRKAASELNAKKPAAVPKAKKTAKTATAKSIVKKTAKSAASKKPLKKAAVAAISKKTPVKGAKKPKSIKSPAKKARASKAAK